VNELEMKWSWCSLMLVLTFTWRSYRNPQNQSHYSHILIYIFNKMQCYTVYFVWKLLYMFWVVPPPIIRSAKNCIYSICYLSRHYCYLLLLRQVAVTVWQISDAVDTVVCAPDDGWIAAGSSNGVTNTRRCRYSCLRFWWWVVVPPETCRAVSR
jgi:hypothetical protein